MRKLWTEPQVTFHGRHYHMDNVSMEPKPLQKPGIPILMGGRADAVLKRSAEEADGWIAGGQGTPEAFREAWQKVCGYAEAAGKVLTLWKPASSCTSALEPTASAVARSSGPLPMPITARSLT